MPNLPVFKIKREDGRAGTKTIHRDHLLPVGELVRIPCTGVIDDPPVRPKPRAETCQEKDRTLPETQETYQELQEDSDSSSDLEYYVSHRTYPKEFFRRSLDAARPPVAIRDEHHAPHQTDDSHSDDSSSADDNAEAEQQSSREPGV